jgi:opacity protein-like surface antigen
VYGGYTFQRFYELPNITENMNGFNLSVVYYWKDWLGADGEFAATHATQDNVSSWFLFGGGGPRFRWSAKKGIELWAHALVGYSHFTPQTPAGDQHAFAYELGGGVDLPFKERWAIRLAGDAMCTRYFNTSQYSPKVSAGLVFRF